MDLKKDMRNRGIMARNAITPEQREALSGQIVLQIAGWEVFRQARTVLIYRAMPHEADLSLLTGLPESEGKRFCYPVVLGKGRMEARYPGTAGAWKTGRFGISEPDPKISALIPPEELDLVLCPCTAFDRQGGRLGMGGGYYDRFLPLCTRATAAAVAFRVQEAERVPMEEMDRVMDWIITEDGVDGPFRTL